MSALTRNSGYSLVQRLKGRPAILLVILVFFIYLPSLFNGFVWDDHFIIVRNDFIKSWGNLKLIFTKQYLTKAADWPLVGVKDIGSGETSYRPVVTLSYFLDYAVWKLNSFGYHLHNLLLHVLNSVLVYFLILRLSADKKVAFLTALLFGWHPVQTEAVCGITNREDLLAMFFGMASFLLFMRLGDLKGHQRKTGYAFSLILFGLALFSKEMAMVFPVLFLLYDYLFIYQNKIDRWIQSRKYIYPGYGIVLLIYIIIRFALLTIEGGPHGEYLGGNGYTHILTMITIMATYLRWLLIPIGIYMVVPEDTSLIVHSILSSEAILSLGFIIAVLYLALRLRFVSREGTFGILWFFVALIPVLNIVPLLNFMASRYMYIPSAGICLFLALLFVKWLVAVKEGRFMKMISWIFIGVVLIGYGALTLKATSIWKDDLAFGHEMARHYPRNARIRCILGTYYQDKGWLEEAKKEYDLTLQLDPKYGKGYLCRGIYYRMKGNIEQAMSDFQKALALDKRLWYTYFYLGNVFLEKGDYPKAMEQYHKLLSIAPRQVGACNNLGVVYFKMGDVAQARKMWEQALEIDPNNAFALMQINNLPDQQLFILKKE